MPRALRAAGSASCPTTSIWRSRSRGFAARSKKRSGAADERRHAAGSQVRARRRAVSPGRARARGAGRARTWPSSSSSPRTVVAATPSPAESWKPGVASLPIRADRLKVRSFYFPQTRRLAREVCGGASGEVGDRSGNRSSIAPAIDAAAAAKCVQVVDANRPAEGRREARRSAATTSCSRRWKASSPAARSTFRSRRFPYQFEGIAFLVSALRRDLGRRDGPRQDDAGDHDDPPVAARRRSAQRAADLPEAAGDELAARVRDLGRRAAGDDHRRGPSEAALAMAPDGVAGQDRQLRSGRPRSRHRRRRRRCKFDLVVLDESQRIKNRTGTTSEVVRSIRRTRSWALTGTPVENSADDLVGIFEFLQPGYLTPGMKPRAHGKAGRRLHHAPHERQGADRSAAEDVSRRRNRAHSAAARDLSPGRRRRRAAAHRHGRPARRFSTCSSW